MEDVFAWLCVNKNVHELIEMGMTKCTVAVHVSATE